MQGAAAFALGTLDDAAVRWHAALAMAQTDADVLLSARATNNLGIVAALKGDAEQAITCYQRAIADYQRLGNHRGLAESWHNMAISFRTRGELNAADDAELRAIEFASEITNLRLVMMAQVGRAEVALRRGDASWARAMAQRAVKHFASIPDYLLESDALRVHADACGRMGFVAEADRSIVRALDLSREHGHLTQEAQALQTSAQMLLARGDVDSARREGTAAREAFSRLGSVTAAEEMAGFLASITR
jgi:tetratricopeptide (TPR) repeat protein